MEGNGKTMQQEQSRIHIPRPPPSRNSMLPRVEDTIIPFFLTLNREKLRQFKILDETAASAFEQSARHMILQFSYDDDENPFLANFKHHKKNDFC